MHLKDRWSISIENFANFLTQSASGVLYSTCHLRVYVQWNHEKVLPVLLSSALFGSHSTYHHLMVYIFTTFICACVVSLTRTQLSLGLGLCFIWQHIHNVLNDVGAWVDIIQRTMSQWGIQEIILCEKWN